MRKILGGISISLPVVLLIFLVRMPSLGNRKLSPLECRVTKWDLPVSLATKSTPKQKTPPQPVLIQRLPVTCCQDDSSCSREIHHLLGTAESVSTTSPDGDIVQKRKAKSN
ncbi:MAG: hypothetical protein ACSI46_12490 [Gloeotrichia echinulata DVL01]|nr:hypothetical protein [Gloeotrichia echinulata DEX184]